MCTGIEISKHGVIQYAFLETEHNLYKREPCLVCRKEPRKDKIEIKLCCSPCYMAQTEILHPPVLIAYRTLLSHFRHARNQIHGRGQKDKTIAKQRKTTAIVIMQ